MAKTGQEYIDKLEAQGKIRGVIKALGNKRDWDTRHAAASALCRIGHADAVKPLIHALQDEHDLVQRKAAEALGRIGDKRAVEPLTAVLANKESGSRGEAAEALGKIGDRAAIEPLLDAIRDRMTHPQSAAALEKLAWKPDSSEAGAWYWIARKKPDKCVAIGRPAVKPLIEALKFTHEETRRLVVEALGKIGDPRAVEPLIKVLKDSLDRENTEEDPIEAQRASDPEMAMLIRIRKSRKKTSDLSDVARALGQIGDTRAVKPLVAALRQGGEDSCEAVARALGQIGDPHAVKPLVASLKSYSTIRRRSAAEALDQLGWTPDRDETGSWYWIAKGDWPNCAAVGVPSIIPLIKVLEEYDDDVGPAEALGRIGAPAVEPLIDALKHRTRDMRLKIANVLKNLYHQGKLDGAAKHKILAHQRDIEERHHTDEHRENAKGCQDYHSDFSQGVKL